MTDTVYTVQTTPYTGFVLLNNPMYNTVDIPFYAFTFFCCVLTMFTFAYRKSVVDRLYFRVSTFL